MLYAGRAQEKATVWRTQRQYHADGSSYAWLVKASALASVFYFYCVDADFGPFFVKFCTYFPYTAKLCLFSEPRDNAQVSNLASHGGERPARPESGVGRSMRMRLGPERYRKRTYGAESVAYLLLAAACRHQPLQSRQRLRFHPELRQRPNL